MFLGYVQSRDRKASKSPRLNVKEEQKYSLESATQKVNYILETVRLTQSQDSQGEDCQFKFNIISPKDQPKNMLNPQILTYQYSAPQWIASPLRKESNKLSEQDKNKNVYQDEPTYIRTIQEVQKTQIFSHSINGQQINSKCEEKSSLIPRQNVLQQYQFDFQGKNMKSSDEQGKSVKSLQLINKSDIVQRILNKSSFITLRQIQKLQKIHDTQLQVYSQYGLKPNQCRRLQKMQDIQRVELQQKYLSTKQNGGKIRKYSQAVPQTENKNNSKQKKMLKKSLSKQKKVLSSQKLLINKVNKIK